MVDRNELVSVIVPVYNVETYVAKCLDSILGQSYINLEIICIDDGSQDGSGAICDEYQRKDSRIKVYHRKNQGVSSARNYGLSIVQGNWFCFVDADDSLHKDYISHLLALAHDNACDLASCDMLETDGNSTVSERAEESVFVFDTSSKCIHNFICNDNSMGGRCTNKIYLASKFKDIRFSEALKINEDCLYTYDIMRICSRACFTTRQLYYLLFRTDSACHKKPQTADFSAANVFLTLYERALNEQDEEVLCTLRTNYLNTAVRVLLLAKYDRKNSQVREARRRCKEWRNYVWKYLSLKNKLKYYMAICRFW